MQTGGAMKKILLLDDNADIVQIVEEVLSYEHFDVKSLNSVNGFMEAANAYMPDLIILDFRLDGTNGGQLCQKIRREPELRQTPIIIFSAYTEPGLDFKVFGCDAFIAKPFDLEQLVETINNLTDPQEIND
jgi:DNA-binding response OmpR family regulator